MDQPILEGPATTEEAAAPAPETPATAEPAATENHNVPYTLPHDAPDPVDNPPWVAAEAPAPAVEPAATAEPAAAPEAEVVTPEVAAEISAWGTEQAAQPAEAAAAPVDGAALQAKDEEIARLQAELKQKEDALQALGAQVARQEQSISGFQTQGIQKDTEIRDLRDKLADTTGQYTRLNADFENHRRRTTQERENLVKFAGERVITNLLPIFDNFGRAMQAANAIDTQALMKGLEALVNQVKGLDMIRRQLDDLMQKSGVALIPTVGEHFDPNLHEAVMLEDTTEHPDQTIIAELQSGYTLSGKVIRAAMVKVANNPTGTAAVPAAAEPAAPSAEPAAEAASAEPAAATAVEAGGWDQISQGLDATDITVESVPTEESET